MLSWSYQNSKNQHKKKNSWKLYFKYKTAQGGALHTLFCIQNFPGPAAKSSFLKKNYININLDVNMPLNEGEKKYSSSGFYLGFWSKWSKTSISKKIYTNRNIFTKGPLNEDSNWYLNIALNRVTKWYWFLCIDIL